MDFHYAYIPIKIGIPVDSANLSQDYSTGYAQDLDEIRALLMTIAQRLQALSVRHIRAMCISFGYAHFFLTVGTPFRRGKDGTQPGA